jgi:type I restriction enzyme S subunit
MYGSRLRGVYLFGSYARGEATSDSDIDVLIVLDGFERYGAEVERVSYLSSELSLKFNTSVNVVFTKDEDWQKADTPFLSNVRREAVAA